MTLEKLKIKEDEPHQTGVKKKRQVFQYFTKMRKFASTKTAKKWVKKMKKTTKSYAPGLFLTENVSGLLSQNNELEGSLPRI